MSSQLYLVDRRPHDEAGPYQPLSEHIDNGSGRSLNDYPAGTPDHEVFPGVAPSALGRTTLRIGRSGRTGDVLTYAFRHTLILRVGVLGVIDSQGLSIDPSVHRVLLDLRRRWSLNCRPDPYTILWPTVLHEVLDVDRSDVRFFQTTRLIEKIGRWVADRAKLPAADLFPTAHYAWLCSERFRETFEAYRFTGASFRAVEIA